MAQRVAQSNSSCYDTVNPEIFARILFSRIALKKLFAALKVATRAWYTYISKRSDFGISRGFYFHETSHKTLANISKLTVPQFPGH